MGSRPQSDIDAEAYEAKQFASMEKKGGAGAELVAAIRLARQARTQAGLNCDYTESGEARFSVQQGLKAAVHGREDVAATLILQVKIIQRLDQLKKIGWGILGVLIVIALKVFL